MGILFWVVIVTGRRCGTFGKQRFIRCVCCMFGVVTIYHVVIKRVYMVACCGCVGVWVCQVWDAEISCVFRNSPRS